MSIMELGALGEFVAAVAVLITLLYLTAQVKQAKELAQQSAVAARNSGARELQAQFADCANVSFGHKSEVERSPCQRLLLAQRRHGCGAAGRYEMSPNDAGADVPQSGSDRLSSATSGHSGSKEKLAQGRFVFRGVEIIMRSSIT